MMSQIILPTLQSISMRIDQAPGAAGLLHKLLQLGSLRNGA